MRHLTEAELHACFDPSWHLRNVDAIFAVSTSPDPAEATRPGAASVKGPS
jgi:hypothetical protein